MTDPNSESRVIRDLEEKIKRNETEIQQLRRALYGDPELGMQGFRAEILGRLDILESNTAEARRICEDLRQERRDELSERRGLRKAVGYTGVTNLLTLLTVIVLIIGLWQGLFGGG